ncbi:MAG: 30S ribosomal protein S20 [Bacteroidia bacterium]
MAHHASAIKRIRQNAVKRLRNRYYKKTLRNAIKKLRNTHDKAEAQKQLVEVSSMLDKLAKKKMIHRNKAANNKSKLSRLVNSLS